MATQDFGVPFLSCSVCLEKFDSAGRRPKVLPCGHTHCLGCLGCLERNTSRLCPLCRKPYETEPRSLPDNFLILQALDYRPPIVLQRSTFWCWDCKTSAQDTCVDENHEVCSLSKLHAKYARSVGDAQRVVDALKGLSCQVQKTLESWLQTLQRLQGAEQTLAKHCRSGDSEGPEQDRLAVSEQDLSREGSWIVEAAEQCRASLELEDAPPELEIDCSKDLTPGDPASLQDPRLYKVTTLRYVPCDDHPDWSVALLQKVAVRLQRLHVVHPQRQHLAAIQGMSRLRALNLQQNKVPSDAPPLPRSLEQVEVQRPSSSQLLDLHGMPRLHSLDVWSSSSPLPSSFPPLPQGQGLRLLMVYARPASSCLPLVRAHAATLQDLWVECEPDPDSDEHFPDLGRELSGLTALRRLVLWREGHNKQQCREEKRRVRAVLRTSVEVLCKECDNVSWPDLWALQ